MFNFDFPLSPKARTYLKLEQVFKNCAQCTDLNSLPHVMLLLRSIVDYIDLVDGSNALKIEIFKDLDRCQIYLKSWQDNPDVNKELLNSLTEQITNAKKILDGFSRQCIILKEDPLVELLKPRFLAPCGVNSFDTPLFYSWFEKDLEFKSEFRAKWQHELDYIKIPISTILYIWRLCADPEERIAKKGFMQETAETCEFINIEYEGEIRGYPVVSGFQSRLNIRFLPIDKGALVGDIPFKLTYIGNLNFN